MKPFKPRNFLGRDPRAPIPPGGVAYKIDDDRRNPLAPRPPGDRVWVEDSYGLIRGIPKK